MRLRALTCVLAAVALAGCGGSDADEAEAPPGDVLVVYTALPLGGPGAERARDILAGERLALAQARGRAGPFEIRLRPLDDAAPEEGWEPGPTVDAARAAAADPATIAYLGDVDAGATALSLPTTNALGILQVSPATTYDGFTGGPSSTPGEPDKYQPSGMPTFGRIAPADSVQAEEIVALLADRGCRRLAVLSAPNAFDASLAELVEEAARRRGVRVVHSDQVRPDPESHADAAADVVAAGAQCATLAAGPADLPAEVVQALHAADPELRIAVGLGLAHDAFARALGPAAEVTEIVGPPPPSEPFAAAFAREWGREPGPWAAYGHEAMRRVLDVLRRLGAGAGDREAVTRAYLDRYEPTGALAVWRGGRAGLQLVRELPPA
ncbi:MAG TPA: ABC transporter substrate-binding protein [Capillimicrobium sp.]|nr:ABC transporter substrate-binding protein [Capillimicrobium sp.]